jgi:hypothetical protein
MLTSTRAGVSKSLARSLAHGVILSSDEMATDSGSRTQWPTAIIADSVRYRSSQILLLVLAICFVLQVFSPLRLNNDAITLLSMGESAAHGGGFLNDGQKTFLPSGYPALLAVLLKAGFAHPWVIVGLNMVFLSVGLFAAYCVLSREFFEDRTLILLICSFSLLSYVVIKHSTIPLTDVPFFCCSMSCIAVMSRARRVDSNLRFAVLASASGLLAVAAMAVRTVGVALFPPLIFVIVSSLEWGSLLKGFSIRARLIIAAVWVLVGGGATLLLATTKYWGFLIGVAKNANVPGLILQILSDRLLELGELLGNFPTSKLPTKLHFMVPWMGLVLLVVVLLGLATKRKKIGPTEVFLICYMGILFAWPFYDARYWLPVIPLLIAYTVLAVKSLRFPKAVIAIYCIAYATLGFGVIAYSSRISFAGCKFADRYGDGSLRATYCATLRACGDCGDPHKVDAKVLRLLREYK